MASGLAQPQFQPEDLRFQNRMAQRNYEMGRHRRGPQPRPIDRPPGHTGVVSTVPAGNWQRGQLVRRYQPAFRPSTFALNSYDVTDPASWGPMRG